MYWLWIAVGGLPIPTFNFMPLTAFMILLVKINLSEFNLLTVTRSKSWMAIMAEVTRLWIWEVWIVFVQVLMPQIWMLNEITLVFKLKDKWLKRSSDLPKGQVEKPCFGHGRTSEQCYRKF